MTLQQFLIDKELTAIETLPAPDNRLFNIIIDDGQLYGIQLDNIPSNTLLIRREPVILENNFITVDGFTFDTTEYLVLI